MFSVLPHFPTSLFSQRDSYTDRDGEGGGGLILLLPPAVIYSKNVFAVLRKEKGEQTLPLKTTAEKQRAAVPGKCGLG